jgi:hypothetical protein
MTRAVLQIRSQLWRGVRHPLCDTVYVLIPYLSIDLTTRHTLLLIGQQQHKCSTADHF